MIRKREENQTVECKESWHEKYLEWICGYANAKGGTLYVGIEDGTKRPVGIRNPNKLMEDIPNSIRNTMGVVADVSLFTASLPSLIYGLTKEQLVASILPPVAPLVTPPVAPPVMPPVTANVPARDDRMLSDRQKLILISLVRGELSSSEIVANISGLAANDLRRRYMRYLLDAGYVEYTVPGKPNSRLQKYRLTAKGHALALLKNG